MPCYWKLHQAVDPVVAKPAKPGHQEDLLLGTQPAQRNGAGLHGDFPLLFVLKIHHFSIIKGMACLTVHFMLIILDHFGSQINMMIFESWCARISHFWIPAWRESMKRIFPAWCRLMWPLVDTKLSAQVVLPWSTWAKIPGNHWGTPWCPEENGNEEVGKKTERCSADMPFLFQHHAM